MVLSSSNLASVSLNSAKYPRSELLWLHRITLTLLWRASSTSWCDISPVEEKIKSNFAFFSWEKGFCHWRNEEFDEEYKTRKIPEMYKSTWTPFKTELPDPGQTANDSTTESNALLAPIATWTVLMPVCCFTRSIASANVIGVGESTWAVRPQPMSLFSADGKIICDSLCGKARASQSPIAPRLLSQLVCGEYNAMRFSRHTDTNRVFHDLRW